MKNTKPKTLEKQKEHPKQNKSGGERRNLVSCDWNNLLLGCWEQKLKRRQAIDADVRLSNKAKTYFSFKMYGFSTNAKNGSKSKTRF